MREINRTTIWRNAAVTYLDNAIEYIRSDSPQNAQKIIEEINAILFKAAKNLEQYSLDKFRKNNNGSYRVIKYIIIEFHFFMKNHNY